MTVPANSLYDQWTKAGINLGFFDPTTGLVKATAVEDGVAGTVDNESINEAIEDDPDATIESLGLTEVADNADVIFILSGADTTPDVNTKVAVPIPSRLNGWSLTAAKGNAQTVSSSGTPTFTLTRYRAGSSANMLSTNPVIDINEYSSTTGTPAVVNASNDDVNTDDFVVAEITVVGTGTKGVSVTARFTAP